MLPRRRGTIPPRPVTPTRLRVRDGHDSPFRGWAPPCTPARNNARRSPANVRGEQSTDQEIHSACQSTQDLGNHITSTTECTYPFDHTYAAARGAPTIDVILDWGPPKMRTDSPHDTEAYLTRSALRTRGNRSRGNCDQDLQQATKTRGNE